ncbi:MAG: BMP family ABC transporter substrate-binding protein [Rhodomicrobium sp.]
MSIRINRRTFLQGTAGSVAAITAGIGLAGRASAAGKLTIGIIYVGPRDDFGWNQAHAVAAKALKQVPGVTVVEEENVPETIAVAKTMESMITLDGAKLILPTSFGYFDPFMIDMAKKYPDVQFRHAAPLWNKDKHPANAGSYYCYLDQAHYVNGVAAAASSKTGKLGYVAAKPIGVVLRGANSFITGARSVNPNATVQLIFTGDWSLPVREAEATNALVDAGVDVVGCYVDSPKVVVETAEKRGVKTCGHNASQAVLAPKGFITGAEYKWETIYKSFAADLEAGKPLPNVLTGGYDKDMLRSSTFGAGATDKAKAMATAAIEKLKKSEPIFHGPLKDNTGKVVLEKASYDNLAPELNSMNYLLDGIIGSLT